MPASPADLVTIGIPTFNRARLLDRAIASVLAQDHANVELVVSDNASTDGTEAVCRAWAGKDARMRYIRQPENQGPTRNFHAVLEPARGAHFMWLSDDDWLDANYIGACMAALRDPGIAVAAGRCMLYRGTGEPFKLDDPTNLTQPTIAERLIGYYSAVAYNSIFYGVMRTPLVRDVGMRNQLGADWVVVARMLLEGAAVTVEGTRVHRTIGGTSKNVRNIIKVLGLPWRQRFAPELVIALNNAKALEAMTWPDGASSDYRHEIATRVRDILVLRRTKVRRYMPRRVKEMLIAKRANLPQEVRGKR